MLLSSAAVVVNLGFQRQKIDNNKKQTNLENNDHKQTVVIYDHIASNENIATKVKQ